jgi:hypothetical protein
MAAHALHMETKQWSSKDNEIIAAAKRLEKDPYDGDFNILAPRSRH